MQYPPSIRRRLAPTLRQRRVVPFVPVDWGRWCNRLADADLIIRLSLGRPPPLRPWFRIQAETVLMDFKFPKSVRRCVLRAPSLTSQRFSQWTLGYIQFLMFVV